MTVEEAKEKMCPYAIIAYFMPGNTKGFDACVANKCMAWRWCDANIKVNGYCGLCGKEGAE